MVLTENQFNQIKQLYESGETTKEISKKLNISYCNTNYRINLIKQNKTKQHFVPNNENFFENIDTEEKAYWLGFIYADGCIHRNNILSINLSIVDEIHLQKLANIFGRNLIKYNSNEFKYILFQIHNSKIYTDLTNHGLEERKTYSDNVTILEYVPDYLMSHFVRGEFDGDGCISKNGKNKKTSNAKISIVGNPNFLQKLQKIIVKILNLKETKIQQKPGFCCELEYGGNKQIEKIYNWIYLDATIWLERKRCKFEEILYTKLDSYKDIKYSDKQNSPYKGSYKKSKDYFQARIGNHHIKYCNTELEAAYYHDLEQVRQRGEEAKRFMNFPSKYEDFVQWTNEGY